MDLSILRMGNFNPASLGMCRTLVGTSTGTKAVLKTVLHAVLK